MQWGDWGQPSPESILTEVEIAKITAKCAPNSPNLEVAATVKRLRDQGVSVRDIARLYQGQKGYSMRSIATYSAALSPTNNQSVAIATLTIDF